jgi:hypothetical protein
MKRAYETNEIRKSDKNKIKIHPAEGIWPEKLQMRGALYRPSAASCGRRDNKHQFLRYGRPAVCLRLLVISSVIAREVRREVKKMSGNWQSSIDIFRNHSTLSDSMQ